MTAVTAWRSMKRSKKWKMFAVPEEQGGETESSRDAVARKLRRAPSPEVRSQSTTSSRRCVDSKHYLQL